MVWRRTGNKPLSEPMMTQLNDAYMCVTRPQWVNPCMDIYLFIPSEVWDEITYPFPNFNINFWSLGMDK